MCETKLCHHHHHPPSASSSTDDCRSMVIVYGLLLSSSSGINNGRGKAKSARYGAIQFRSKKCRKKLEKKYTTGAVQMHHSAYTPHRADVEPATPLYVHHFTQAIFGASLVKSTFAAAAAAAPHRFNCPRGIASHLFVGVICCRCGCC